MVGFFQEKKRILFLKQAMQDCVKLFFNSMSFQFIETLGLYVDPDQRKVRLEDGTTRSLTKREYRVMQVVIGGQIRIGKLPKMYLHWIALSMD